MYLHIYIYMHGVLNYIFSASNPQDAQKDALLQSREEKTKGAAAFRRLDRRFDPQDDPKRSSRQCIFCINFTFSIYFLCILNYIFDAGCTEGRVLAVQGGQDQG